MTGIEKMGDSILFVLLPGHVLLAKGCSSIELTRLCIFCLSPVFAALRVIKT